MIKSSSKNGIRVEKDIELVMKNTGNTPWYDYLFQFLILAAICTSICFCITTGLEIEVNAKSVILIIGLMVAYCMVVYSFRSIFKYSGIISFFLYVMFGYINLERLQSGYAGVYNIFIQLYNDYFNTSAGTVMVPGTAYENGEQYFLLFIMAILVAVICYTGMYGRSMFAYIIFTAPIVYLPLVVGYTPSLMPYLVYIIGTVALFAGCITEKYGLFSKANRVQVGQFVVHTLEKARVKAQLMSVVILVMLFGIIYFWYSPERYEREFDANEIKTQVQTKIKEVTSSDFLKDTIFGEMTSKLQLESSGGMSNGRLGKVGTIKYDHSVALNVTTEKTDNNKSLYLKGYVGEMYTGESWRQLSKSDQAKVDSINERLKTGDNVETMNQRFLDLYSSGLYPYYSAERLSCSVEKIGADSSCDYVPYNSMDQYELYNGKIQTMNAMNDYVMFKLPENKNNLSYYENFLKYGKFSALLQLNMLNSRVVEKNLGVESIEQFEQDDLTGEQQDRFGNIDTIPIMDIDGSVSSDDDTMVGIVGAINQFEANELCRLLARYSLYEDDENAYFNLVKEIYTKLPDSGLERVKDLVKDKKVDLEGIELGEQYKVMNQIDTTSYAKALYEKYQQSPFIDLDEICSDQFTYGELMNQDKIFDAVSYVKDYLAKNTTYTLSPGVTPEDEDYVEDFLFTKKKGYCMHYASAATVMLRAMGVPARYVEGYVITEEDFSKANLVGSSTCDWYVSAEEDADSSTEEDLVQISVEDTNSHAWVEVYLPGYGWTPIEMTAAYSDGQNIEIPPVNKDPKATLKPTKKPTATATAKPTGTPAATKAPSGSATNPPTSAAANNTSLLKSISKWYHGLSSTVRTVIQVILWIILVIVLAVLAIVGRRKLLCMLFVKGMEKRAPNERILYGYRELARFTSREMPEYTTNMAYKEYVKLFVTSYPFIKEEDADAYFAILLKAKFGMQTVSEEEEQVAKAFYHSFMSTMEQGSKLGKRLYYRYIFVLRQ